MFKKFVIMTIIVLNLVSIGVWEQSDISIAAESDAIEIYNYEDEDIFII